MDPTVKTAADHSGVCYEPMRPNAARGMIKLSSRCTSPFLKRLERIEIASIGVLMSSMHVCSVLGPSLAFHNAQTLVTSIMWELGNRWALAVALSGTLFENLKPYTRCEFLTHLYWPFPPRQRHATSMARDKNVQPHSSHLPLLFKLVLTPKSDCTGFKQECLCT